MMGGMTHFHDPKKNSRICDFFVLNLIDDLRDESVVGGEMCLNHIEIVYCHVLIEINHFLLV